MPTMKTNLGDGTQAVLLTVTLLEALAEADAPQGVTRLAERLGTSKSRIHRHLQTLETCGFVIKLDGSGRYGVGDRLLALARLVDNGQILFKAAQPLMEDLRDQFAHSVVVSRVDRDSVTVLQSISGRSDFVLEFRPGTSLPLGNSAQGKVVLAFIRPQDMVKEGNVAQARRALDATQPGELPAILGRGWAAAPDGMTEGVNGVAVPVFASNGRLVATLGLFDTIGAMGHSVHCRTIEALRQAGQKLSRQLGGEAPSPPLKVAL